MESQRGMKVLVTGGTGFIGSHVVEALHAGGYQPIVMTRQQQKDSKDGILYVLGDLMDYEVVEETIARCDGIIHLAGILGTTESISLPELFVRTNVLGSLNVFDACRSFKKPCIYVSVGNVDDNNMYAITKHTAERLALMYNKEHGTEIVPVRVYNVYGERQKAEPIKKLIPSAVEAALRNEPITIFGGGSQQNDFVYVKDVAANLLKALDLQEFAPQNVYELGTCIATPVKLVAETIIRLANSQSQVVVKGDRRAGENTGLLIAKREKLIDSKFDFTPLETGLEQTIGYSRERMKQ